MPGSLRNSIKEHRLRNSRLDKLACDCSAQTGKHNLASCGIHDFDKVFSGELISARVQFYSAADGCPLILDLRFIAELQDDDCELAIRGPGV